jgi:hypothetical protein
MSFACSSQGELFGQCMWHMWSRRKMCTEFWWGNMKGRKQLARQKYKLEGN